VKEFLWMLKPISDRRWKIREKANIIDARRAGVINVQRTKRFIKETSSKHNFSIFNIW